MRILFFHLLTLCLAFANHAFCETPQERIAAQAGLEQKLNSQVPINAEFRDENGKAIKLGKLFGGKPVILVLAYYQCPNLCTLVLNGLLQTVQDLKFDAGQEYQIVVVSIDPKEGPVLASAKKRAYLRGYGRPGSSNGWHFLTGDQSTIAKLADQVGYRFAWDEATRQFAHPSAIMVLTPQGRVARYFPGIEYPPKEVRLALIEASENRIGSFADRLFLLCYHYNPHSGKYGLLIWRVMQLAGSGTVAVLLCCIALLLRRERAASTSTSST